MARLAAVRKALGPAFDIMTDANQGFTVSEAIRRARHYEELDIAWFEEPLPAEDLNGHVLLSQSTSMPDRDRRVAVPSGHFREYLQRGACSIVQVDVGRVGGITPWLKVAHLAETFNVQVCPHYLMEIHLGLCCAVPNATWLEHIPQLDRHHSLAHRHRRTAMRCRRSSRAWASTGTGRRSSGGATPLPVVLTAARSSEAGQAREAQAPASASR